MNDQEDAAVWWRSLSVGCHCKWLVNIGMGAACLEPEGMLSVSKARCQPVTGTQGLCIEEGEGISETFTSWSKDLS